VDTPVYENAGNYFDRKPRVPPAADAPEVIAAAIVRATDRSGSSERHIGLVNRPMIVAYRLVPRVFDAVIAPLLRTVSFEPERRPAG
jgi:hypothetical protein